jgi:glycosyltransferase involved in cell wall biosynthesis
MQMFHFLPQKTARKETSFPDDWYVTAMVNRNQPRKRLDLGIYFFSEWVKRTNKPDTVKLYYHGALQDMGIDILDYAQYCGIDNRMIVTSHNMTLNSMLPADKLKFVYNSADVYFTPCTSEGWSLTLHEAMACAIPCIVPNSSAMAEWPKGAVEYIDIVPNLPTVNTGMVNTIMDTPSLDSFIEKAELLYNNPQYRKDLGFKGFKRATESRFKWSTIATQFEAIFDQLVKGKK